MQVFKNVKTGKTVMRDAPQEKRVEYDGKMMILEIDKDGIITYTNRTLRDMLDYDKEEIIGLPYTVSLHPDMPEGLYNQALEIANAGEIWSGYEKSMTRNGHYFWTAVCIQPKYQMDQSINGYIIRKKPPEDDIIREVQKEYARLASEEISACRSEFCGELNFHS
ncbi:MAG: PAS domain-containing protein [Campylobacterales bacterium]|nr:PAS domain-containing protein [Campylobacterales bacterium]